MDPIVIVLILTFVVAAVLAVGGAVVRQYHRMRRRRSAPEEIPLLFGGHPDYRPPTQAIPLDEEFFPDREDVVGQYSPEQNAPAGPLVGEERSLPGTVVATEASRSAEKYVAGSENGTRSEDRVSHLPSARPGQRSSQVFAFDDDLLDGRLAEKPVRPVRPHSNGKGTSGGSGVVPGRPERKSPDLEATLNASPPIDDIEVFEGRAVRFHRPDERTMRLLPGRLEVERGEDNQSEIRFVDHTGARAAVTFGREAGEPLLHVQLRSPTVSRRHARMAWNGDGWVIANLSETNPIVLNGVVLDEPHKEYPLQDGDRIEMGEVVFRYRR